MQAICTATPSRKPTVFVNASAVGIYPATKTSEKAPVYDENSDVSAVRLSTHLYSDVDAQVQAPTSDDYFQRLVAAWEAESVLPKEMEKQVRRVNVRLGIVIGRGGEICTKRKLNKRGKNFCRWTRA